MLARKIYGYTAVISIVFRNYNRAVGKFHVKICRLPYCMDFSFGASFLSTEGKDKRKENRNQYCKERKNLKSVQNGDSKCQKQDATAKAPESNIPFYRVAII